MNEILKKIVKSVPYKKVLPIDVNDAYKEGFKNGAEYAISQQWISVEEAMPELNEEVLVLFPDGSATVALRHKTFNAFGGDAIVWRNGDYTYDDSWIKFWMPIPKFNPDKPNNP